MLGMLMVLLPLSFPTFPPFSFLVTVLGGRDYANA
jgi:hypothetical protein